MKKLFGIATIAVISLLSCQFFAGANQKIKAEADSAKLPYIHEQTSQSFVDRFSTYAVVQIIKVDGCQYVVYRYHGTGVTMVHKENCENPIHKQNK